LHGPDGSFAPIAESVLRDGVALDLTERCHDASA
jgi:hypothetical protein